MDIAKLRLPAWTESDGQRTILDPHQVPADMNEAADEIERLLAALTGVVKVWVNPYDGGDYERGEIPELDAARDALNQQYGSRE